MPVLKIWAILGASFVLTEKSQAATVLWQLEVTITSANPSSSVVIGDTFQGELSYEAASSPTIAAPDLNLQFEFAGQNFDNSDETATGYPLFIQDPIPGLTFCVDLEDQENPAGSFFHIYPDNSFQYSLDGASEYEGWVTFQLIPEPSPLALLLSGGLVAGLLNRKRQ